MLRKISKLGVLYVWERAINTDLEEEMEFDKLICVKRSAVNDYIYSGFFTVKEKGPKKDTFGQYAVQFRPDGGIEKRYLMLFSYEESSILRELPDSLLICDNRKEFPWI